MSAEQTQPKNEVVETDDVEKDVEKDESAENKWQDYKGKYGGAVVPRQRMTLGSGKVIDYERNRYTHKINGVDLQDVLTPFRIGGYCGEMESRRKGGPAIVWDNDRQAWFIWKWSRWWRLPMLGGRVKGAEAFFCAVYQDDLIDWAMELYYENPQPGQFRRVAIIREGCFHTDEFLLGARQKLTRELGEQDKRRIALDGHVLYISRGGVEIRKSDRNKDIQMQASRVKLTAAQARDGAWLKPGSRWVKAVADLFASWFVDDVIDETGTSYVQRLLGAALLGRLRKSFIVIRGSTGAGKSLLLRLMESALGDLCISTRGDVFVDKDPNDYLALLIDLQPRFILLNEYGTKALTAVALNRITGGDTMVAAAKYQQPISGKVEATPILAQEVLPRFAGATRGTFERQIVIEMSKPREPNPDLVTQAEDVEHGLVRGFLAWLLLGARAVEQFDIFVERPAWVRNAMREAYEDQDFFGAWLLGPINPDDEDSESVEAWIDAGGKTATEIYQAYLNVHRDIEDSKPERDRLNALKVGQRMSGYGFEQIRTRNERLWYPAR